jgi:ABC-2 type transport system permease protein
MLDLVLGMVSFLVYFFISRTFQTAPIDELQGAPTYFDFAAIGIAITVVVEAATTGLAERMRQEQLTGTLEMLVAQPLTAAEVSLGLAGFPFFFAVVRAALYLLLGGALLGLDLSHTSWTGFFLVLITTGVAFVPIGVMLGALVIVLKRGQVLASVVIFSMGLLSGAYFPVDVLPGWLRPVGKAFPMRFALDGLRAAVFRGSDWGGDLVPLIAFSLLGFPVALLCFAQALRFVERSGSLGQY